MAKQISQANLAQLSAAERLAYFRSLQPAVKAQPAKSPTPSTSLTERIAKVKEAVDHNITTFVPNYKAAYDYYRNQRTL